MMKRLKLMAGIVVASLMVAPPAAAQDEDIPGGSADSLLRESREWLYSLPGVGGTENTGTRLLVGIPFVILTAPLQLIAVLEVLADKMSSRG